MQAGLPKPRPDGQSTQVACMFSQGFQESDHLAIEEAELAGIEGNIDGGNLLQDAIERERKELVHAIARAAAALHVNDLITLFPEFDELRNRLGRVLQVGIHEDHSAATGPLEAGADGDGLAETP